MYLFQCVWERMCHFCRVALLWCVSKDLTCRQPAQVTDGGAPVEHPTRRAARFSAQESPAWMGNVGAFSHCLHSFVVHQMERFLSASLPFTSPLLPWLQRQRRRQINDTSLGEGECFKAQLIPWNHCGVFFSTSHGSPKNVSLGFRKNMIEMIFGGTIGMSDLSVTMERKEISPAVEKVQECGQRWKRIEVAAGGRGRGRGGLGDEPVRLWHFLGISPDEKWLMVKNVRPVEASEAAPLSASCHTRLDSPLIYRPALTPVRGSSSEVAF